MLLTAVCFAQQPVRRPGGVRLPTTNTPTPGQPNPVDNRGAEQGGRDTTISGVERREYGDDSLRVEVYSFTSVRPTTFDTLVRDYTLRFPIPATHIYLGNDGAATRSLLFGTPQPPGWVPGFNSDDV